MTTHRITLPGPPVSADVSWDMVRAYLRREGWERRAQESGMELWQPAASEPGALGSPTAWITDYSDGYDTESEIGTTVKRLARLASVSPGEMLARIVGQPAEPCRCPSIQQADPLRHFTGCPLREPLPAGHPNEDPTTIARRAAEDMRERCAVACENSGPDVCIPSIDCDTPSDARRDAAAAIRAIPIPGADPSPLPDLWRRIRARLGDAAIQVTAEYRDATSMAPRYLVTWRSGSGQYRQEERTSESDCLRLVLAIEGAGDATS